MSVVVNDANYNVMGMVELGYALHVHKQFHPYGRPLWLFDEGNHIVGDPEYGPLLDDSGFFEDPNERHIENHDTPHRMTHGFAGGMLDPETYFLWLRNRNTHVKLGRMASPDPNGTALVLTTALGQFGAGPLVNAHVSPMLQYADGLSPYQYVRSNPNTGQDPTGLFTFLDLTATTALQGELLSMQVSNGISTADAMKGVIFWAMERNATMDQALGLATDGWDSQRAQLDTAFAALNMVQTIQDVTLVVGGAAVAYKAAKLGKKLWQKYVSRAGGRSRLLGVIDRGTNAFRKFFGFRAGSAARGAGQGYRSFSALKRALGPAGPGKAWHHIVEKTPANVGRFGAEAIHNTANVVRLPHGKGTIHARISGYYSSKQDFTGGRTVRQWLSEKSFEDQFQFGIETIKRFGGG